MFRILVTDFSRTVSGACPAQLSHFILNDKARAANASVFVAGWRSHMQHFGSYDALSGAVARELGLSNVIAGLSAESLAETMTFEEVERRIIQDIKGRIIASAGAGMETLRGLIARRRDGHWANKLLAHSSATTRALASCYDALHAKFLTKHIRNFFKRIFYNYFLRDMSIASFELVGGTLLLLFGLLYGSYHWWLSLATGIAATTGTVMLAVLPVLVGFQMLLAFLAYDFASVPKLPMSDRLGAGSALKPTR